jgi:hypothetical protein
LRVLDDRGWTSVGLDTLLEQPPVGCAALNG